MLQVTAVLVVPVTLAVKVCVASRSTVTELGVTVRLTLEAGVGVGEDELREPPPQPQQAITAAITRAMALKRNLTLGNTLVRPIVCGNRMLPSSARFLSRAAQFRRPCRKADRIAMARVWSVSDLRLIVQLSEFRGLVQNAHCSCD
jgi:hypothetical protein